MVETTPPAVVRAYRPGEDADVTQAVYLSAVTRTAAADYDPAQIAAWAGAGADDLPRWDARRAAAHTFVAVVDGQVAGFTDYLDDGLLDMLFVHPDFGRRGIARLLVDTVKREARLAGLTSLRTCASRTARPAFEKFGFRVTDFRADNAVNGQVVPNYAMTCDRLSE